MVVGPFLAPFSITQPMSRSRRSHQSKHPQLYFYDLSSLISDCDLVFPACIMNGVAVSKTFEILYRNEDVIVNDIITFRVHMLVDSQKVGYLLIVCSN
jgi:hypothetical protein